MWLLATVTEKIVCFTRVCNKADLYDRPKPAKGSTLVGCCGNRVFDTRIRMCCYGVLYPNAEHLRCCGHLGQAVDTTIQSCVDGRPMKIEAKLDFLAMNSTNTNATTESNDLQ